MAIIAFANLKGGVGKSTLAVNVAGALAAQSPKTRIVLVDADPQGTASTWAEGGALPFGVEALPLTKGARAWIGRVLEIEADELVIDLPPMLGETAAAALAIAELAAIPVTPSGADLAATGRALELVRNARKERGDGRPKALLIPSRVDRRTAAGAEIEAVLHDYGEPVAPVISQRIAHADAFTAGRWIGDYAPGSAGHTEIRALANVVKRLAR